MDVETTLYSKVLCLVQLGTRDRIFVIDALEMSRLDELATLLADDTVVKIIHNASFERGVLTRHQIELANVVDTLKLSRSVRGQVEGGHSLAAVCQRELGIDLDKSEQTSDWTRRPRSRKQLAYAALDVAVLPKVWDCLVAADRQERLV